MKHPCGWEQHSTRWGALCSKFEGSSKVEGSWGRVWPSFIVKASGSRRGLGFAV